MWQNTHKDLQTQLKIKMGFENARLMQDFQGIAFIVSKAFGSSKETVKPPDTFDEAEAQLNAVLGN